jgi:hypothetical protein
MTRKQSLIILIFTVAILVVAATVVYREYFNEEGAVYLSFLNQFDKDKVRDVAFLSAPSVCGGANRQNMPDASEELFSSYLNANDKSAVPINLRELEGRFNVVSFDEANRLHENNLLHLFKSSSKKLIKLSRVGFDNSKTHALFCIEPGGMGLLVYLVKENGLWKVQNSDTVWVS